MHKLVKLATLENEFEAQLLAAILRERNIAVLIRPYQDTAYGIAMTGGWGWGAVYGDVTQEKAVCELLQEIRSYDKV